MINSIIDAISAALDREFGEGYEIHMEELGQDLEEPCFFISCLNPSRSPFPGKRYFQTIGFCIQYFPATGEKQRECNDVAERLYSCLEYVMADDGPVMGTGMEHKVADGILNFFVDYDFFVRRMDQQTPTGMNELKSGTAVREGE